MLVDGGMDSAFEGLDLMKGIDKVIKDHKITCILGYQEREVYVKRGLRARKGDQPGEDEAGKSNFMSGLSDFCPGGIK